MSYKFARKVKNFCFIAASIFALVAIFLPYTGLRIAFAAVAAVVMIGGIVVNAMFYRCPACKKMLPTNESLPKNCPYCGEQLR